MTEKNFNQEDYLKGISMDQKEKTNHPVEKKAKYLLMASTGEKQQIQKYGICSFSNQKNVN